LLERYRKNCSVIVIERDTDFYQAFNTLQRIFDSYDKWETELRKIIDRSGSVSQLLMCSEPVFGNPLFAIDEDFKILGASIGTATPSTGKGLSGGKTLGIDELDQFLELHDLSMDEHEPLVLTLLDQTTLNYNLFESDAYRGCLTVRYEGRPYRPSDKPLIEQLGRFVLIAKQQLAARAPEGLGSLRQAVQALVEERNGRGSAPNPGRAPNPSEGPDPGRASHPGEGPDPGRAAGALAERRVEFMAGLLREAAAAAHEAEPGELKVERGLRFGERRGGAGARAPVRSVVFARDCYIELSFDSRQLKAVRRYIKLNPARAICKARHPDLFICYRAIKSERFAAFAPRRFDAIGALPILGSPFLFHVRLTLKKTVAEHEAAIQEIVEKARHGMVPVSGFISPGEKEALRRLKAEPSARFVKLLPHVLPARYDPSAEDSREIAAGRLVILSAFPDTPAVASPAMKRDPAAAHRFRQNCLAMNDLAARLCVGG
jgi:hypothetical protein